MTTLLTSPAQAERRKVGMLIPPPVLAGLLGKAALVLQLMLLGGLHFTVAGGILGGCLMAMSIVLMGLSAKQFKRAGTPVRPVAPSTAVVSKGPYRYSRHPMYLGMAGVLLGSALIMGSVAGVLAAVVFVVIVDLGVARREERYLERVHGDAYRRYAQQVRRWI